MEPPRTQLVAERILLDTAGVALIVAAKVVNMSRYTVFVYNFTGEIRLLLVFYMFTPCVLHPELGSHFSHC